VDLHQIEIFCSLAKLRSFSVPLRHLLCPKTVIPHIKNPERELGIKRLDRLGKCAIPSMFPARAQTLLYFPLRFNQPC